MNKFVTLNLCIVFIFGMESSLALGLFTSSHESSSHYSANENIVSAQTPINFYYQNSSVKGSNPLPKFDLNQETKGHDGGNGGNAVITYKSLIKGEVQKIELFDYWEQKITLGSQFNLEMGSHLAFPRQKVNYVLSRLAKFDPYRAAAIHKVAMHLFDNLDTYLYEGDLADISDDKSVLKPEMDQQKVRFAVRSKSDFSGTQLYYISKYLYEHPQMDSNTRAGIILHEAIYEVLKTETSEPVRFYNYLISSNILNDITQEEYFERLLSIPTFYLEFGVKVLTANLGDILLSYNVEKNPDFVCALDTNSSNLNCTNTYYADQFRLIYAKKKVENSCVSFELNLGDKVLIDKSGNLKYVGFYKRTPVKVKNSGKTLDYTFVTASRYEVKAVRNDKVPTSKSAYDPVYSLVLDEEGCMVRLYQSRIDVVDTDMGIPKNAVQNNIAPLGYENFVPSSEGSGYEGFTATGYKSGSK